MILKQHDIVVVETVINRLATMCQPTLMVSILNIMYFKWSMVYHTTYHYNNRLYDRGNI